MQRRLLSLDHFLHPFKPLILSFQSLAMLIQSPSLSREDTAKAITNQSPTRPCSQHLLTVEIQVMRSDTMILTIVLNTMSKIPARTTTLHQSISPQHLRISSSSDQEDASVALPEAQRLALLEVAQRTQLAAPSATPTICHLEVIRLQGTLPQPNLGTIASLPPPR